MTARSVIFNNTAWTFHGAFPDDVQILTDLLNLHIYPSNFFILFISLAFRRLPISLSLYCENMSKNLGFMV